ncbi:MAG: hypothetical protein IPP62_19000 [bacterium]|nr:hypothetical protein [bacterium]
MRDRTDATVAVRATVPVLLAAARPGSLNDSTALMPPMGNRIESSKSSPRSMKTVCVVP